MEAITQRFSSTTMEPLGSASTSNATKDNFVRCGRHDGENPINSGRGVAMGEGKRKSLARSRILRTAERCIYCANRGETTSPLTLEHMPPISFFQGRSRPSGLEFACCRACNNGTKGADVAAVVLSLISPMDETEDWKLDALQRLVSTLDACAPGLRDELLSGHHSTVWRRTTRGIVEPHVSIQPDGPLYRAYTNVFAAKLAMALYREHVGEPLPLTGATYATVFLNSGLAEVDARRLLKMLPMQEGLRQGRKTSEGQFDYRYNTDERTIVAALAGFHRNLHVLLFATSRPDVYEGVLQGFPQIFRARPGSLLDLLPWR